MEGPSIVILEEELKGRTLSKIDTWGKVLILTFTHKTLPPIITKNHFMMFGSYRINDPKENRIPRIELTFKNGTVYFYSCSFKFVTEDYLESLDRRVDVLAPEWDEDHVLKLFDKKKKTYLCDLFLDQNLFAGSGNIVKNEALFNIRRHPLTKLEDVPKSDWPKLITDIHDYCYNFYFWKKEFQLRRHWQVYRQKYCPVCEAKLIKEKLGIGERSTFYCPNCQNEKSKKEKITLYEVLPVEESNEKEERLDH